MNDYHHYIRCEGPACTVDFPDEGIIIACIGVAIPISLSTPNEVNVVLS